MTLDRWMKLSRREQILSIGAEFERARVWQGKDETLFKGALERALGLVDLTLQAPLGKTELLQMLALRNEIARFYVGDRVESIAALSNAL